MLAAGLENAPTQYEILGRVSCFDIYGAFAYATDTTIVNPVAADVVDNVMAYQLYYSARLQDSSKLAAAVGKISSALNTVDAIRTAYVLSTTAIPVPLQS